MAVRWAAERFDDGLADPLFLVGFPRSGTTMIEQVLGSHPRVVAGDEKPMLVEVSAKITQGASIASIGTALDAMPRARVLELRREYWDSVARHGFVVGVGQVFIDKYPLHISRLSVINRLFPRSRVLVAVRDPRDCCLSGFMQLMDPNPAMMQFMTLDTGARLYDAVMNLYLAERAKLTLATREVYYEDAIADLQTQARAMLEFLGLEWSDKVLSFHERARQRYISTPSHRTVTEPVNTRAMGRWRNYRSHLEPILPLLARYVQEFGYEAA